MSRGELWKGVAIRLITAAAFGVIGYFAIHYALEMVGTFGEGMGVDARSREIYAQSHRIVHLFGAACGLAIGIFGANGNRLLQILAIIALISCGSYGILNMYGFTSANRVTVAATKDAKNAAAELQYKNARADLMSQIKWLEQTAVDAVGRERRRLLAEVDQKRKELSALKPPIATAETILSDPQSTTLAELTGTGARSWLLTLPALLAVLMFCTESLSFTFVGYMLAAIVAMLAAYSATASIKLTSSSEGSGGKAKSDATVARQDATVVPIRAAEATQLQAPPKVSSAPSGAPRATVPLTLARPKYASVDEYLASHPSVSKQRDIADAMGVSEAKVSRDIKRLKGRGKVKADRNGRTNSVTYTPRRNGGLQVVI